MTLQEAVQAVLHHTTKEGGFLRKLHRNEVDEVAFDELLNALKAARAASTGQLTVDRLLAACLFELPWEVENTVDHYKKKSEELGKTVSKMADTLRDGINEFLAEGLEHHFS